MKAKYILIMVFITMVFASFCAAAAFKRQPPSRQEMQGWSWYQDYRQTFLVKTATGEHYVLTVNALRCEKYDTQCVWQEARAWIGAALDTIGAKKITEKEISGKRPRCIIEYTVYQENPEQVSFQCGMGKHQLHYRTLKTFLPYYFGIP